MFVYVYATEVHMHIHIQDMGAQTDERNDCGRRVVNVTEQDSKDTACQTKPETADYQQPPLPPSTTFLFICAKPDPIFICRSSFFCGNVKIHTILKTLLAIRQTCTRL